MRGNRGPPINKSSQSRMTHSVLNISAEMDSLPVICFCCTVVIIVRDPWGFSHTYLVITQCVRMTFALRLNFSTHASVEFIFLLFSFCNLVIDSSVTEVLCYFMGLSNNSVILESTRHSFT